MMVRYNQKSKKKWWNNVLVMALVGTTASLVSYCLLLSSSSSLMFSSHYRTYIPYYVTTQTSHDYNTTSTSNGCYVEYNRQTKRNSALCSHHLIWEWKKFRQWNTTRNLITNDDNDYDTTNNRTSIRSHNRTITRSPNNLLIAQYDAGIAAGTNENVNHSSSS